MESKHFSYGRSEDRINQMEWLKLIWVDFLIAVTIAWSLLSDWILMHNLQNICRLNLLVGHNDQLISFTEITKIHTEKVQISEFT